VKQKLSLDFKELKFSKDQVCLMKAFLFITSVLFSSRQYEFAFYSVSEKTLTDSGNVLIEVINRTYDQKKPIA